LIRLVLSDVDGTLVNSTKELTDGAVRAVQRLRENGVLFAVTSGRPPKGLNMLINPLDITTPLAGFNGGLIVDRTFNTLQELPIGGDYVEPIIDVLQEHEVSTWVYQGTDWFVLDPKGPHVEHEAIVCEFDPTVLKNFDGVRGDVVKIVGVSDDETKMASAARALSERVGDDVSATNSQSYYFDITHRDANKGNVVRYLAQNFSIDPSEIATIGDQENDLLMFAVSGVSIAMGNATDEVKRKATHVTTTNDDEGFAHAVDTFVLNRS
jgi:Cof subfamily protein (haloacid dehalogenase superfamily)